MKPTQVTNCQVHLKPLRINSYGNTKNTGFSCSGEIMKDPHPCQPGIFAIHFHLKCTRHTYNKYADSYSKAEL